MTGDGSDRRLLRRQPAARAGAQALKQGLLG
jgi:hypothetical protein